MGKKKTTVSKESVKQSPPEQVKFEFPEINAAYFRRAKRALKRLKQHEEKMQEATKVSDKTMFTPFNI